MMGLVFGLSIVLSAQAQERASNQPSRLDIQLVSTDNGVDATVLIDRMSAEDFAAGDFAAGDFAAEDFAAEDAPLEAATAEAGGAEPVGEVLAEDGGLTVASSGTALERAAAERIAALEARLARMEDELREQEAANRELALESADPERPQDTISHTGGIVVPAGTVVEDAVSLAGPVDVRGTVRGDAVAMGGGIVVHDGARVHGDAVAFGGPVQVMPGGRVDGDKVALGGSPSMSAVMGPVAELSNGWMAALRGLIRRVAMVLSVAGAGVLVVGLWPRQVHQVAEMVRARPFWTSIAGGILVAAITVGALALTLTFIGIPLALLLLGVLALAAMLGFVAICQALGENIPQLRDKGSWVTFLAGAALLGLVSLLPWVGPLTLAVVGFSAVGAALVTRLGNTLAVNEAA